jgi:DNA-binding HxlR family transcriptional regulator
VSDQDSTKGSLTREDAVLIDFGLAVLSPRWTTEILINLAAGPRRTTQLLKDLKGVSAKTLCQRLRRLSELSIVTRKTFAEVPPRVEYALTAEGHALAGLLHQIRDLGERLSHVDRLRTLVDTDEDAAEDTCEDSDKLSFSPEQLNSSIHQ